MSSRLIQIVFSILLFLAAWGSQAQIQSQLDEQVSRAIQSLEAQNAAKDMTPVEKLRNKKRILENLKTLIFEKVVPELKGKSDKEKDGVNEFENYLLMIPTDAKETLVCADVKALYDKDERLLKNVEHKELVLAKKILNLLCL